MKKYSSQWLVALTVLSTLGLCISGYPQIITDPIPSGFFSVLFYSISYISQHFLFACLSSALVALLWFCIRWTRLQLFLATLPVTFTIAICIMNAKVFSFWRLHINEALLNMYFSKGGGSQIFEVHDATYYWIIMIFTICLIAGFITAWVSCRCRAFLSNPRIFYGLIGLYVVTQSIFIVLCHQNNMRVLQYTLKIPYFYDVSWVRVAQSNGFPVFPKNSLPVQLQSALLSNAKLRYPTHPLVYHLPPAPLNVLLIVVDSLRFDMVTPQNMPNTYQFSQQADQFSNNISGGDCTRPGIFSLFYSIPATYFNNALAHQQSSILIRAFQDNHYHLGLFASAPLTSPPFDQTVFAHVPGLMTVTAGKTPFERDHIITQEMTLFLKNQAKTHHPFFGFLFYDLPHAYNTLTSNYPFHPIGYLNYFDINKHTSPTPYFNLYKNAAFEDDLLIKTILKTLSDNGLSKNTVVIITSDHGQEFNDNHNNYWEHASGFSKYQIQTPMLIAWPGRSHKIYHYETTHFDLAPTLLKNVLGVSNPPSDYSVGQDLYTEKSVPFVVIGNYAYDAVVTQNQVMEFHDSGFYRFTDAQMNPIHSTLDPAIQQKMLYDMTRFTK